MKTKFKRRMEVAWRGARSVGGAAPAPAKGFLAPAIAPQPGVPGGSARPTVRSTLPQKGRTPVNRLPVCDKVTDHPESAAFLVLALAAIGLIGFAVSDSMKFRAELDSIAARLSRGQVLAVDGRNAAGTNQASAPVPTIQSAAPERPPVVRVNAPAPRS